MLVNSFGSRSDEKERKTRAEGLLFPTEDDFSDEKERKGMSSPDVCLATRKQRLWGPRSVLKNHAGSSAECRFWFGGTGVQFLCS